MNTNRRLNRKKKNRANIRNNRRAKKQQGNNSTQTLVSIQPGRFMPNVWKVVLRYTDTLTQRSNSGVSHMSWRYRSSAFDPDPQVLTGAIPGFSELARFYRFYLVEKMVAHIGLANQETVGTVVGAWPDITDHGNNTLLGTAINEYSGNMGGKSAILGAVAGQNRVNMTVSASIKQLFGTHGYDDLDFAAPTTNSPVEPYYIFIGGTPGIGTYSFPMVTRVVIDYHIKFFGYTALDT